MSLRSRRLAAAGGADGGMLLKGRVPGAILHQPPRRVFKEDSEGGAPKRQPCVLKLVCGCNNFVFIGARRLYSLAWVLPVLFFGFFGFCFFFSFGKG